MADSVPKPRWYRLTPDRFVIGLLIVECLLWLSERFQWFSFNAHKGWTVLIAVAAVGATILLMLLSLVIALVFRWRFQFSIRSLLVMVVIAALPFSWLTVEMREAREQKEAVKQIKVTFDWQVGPNAFILPNAQPAEPAFLRTLLTDDFFHDVVQASLHNDAQVGRGTPQTAALF